MPEVENNAKQRSLVAPGRHCATSGAERGFVLISAMWLLLLAASIAALLMLRSMAAARGLAVDENRFMTERTGDDAIEAVAADLLLNGRASRWSQMPTSGTISFGDRSVAVTASAEETMPDVGKADPRVVDGALQDAGLSQATRVALMDRILGAREAGHRIASYAELASIAYGLLAPGSEDCIASIISPFGGSVPPASRESSINRAGTFAHAGANQDGARVGQIIRLTIGSGMTRRVIAMRLIAANDRPYALLDDFESACPPSAGHDA